MKMRFALGLLDVTTITHLTNICILEDFLKLQMVDHSIRCSVTAMAALIDITSTLVLLVEIMNTLPIV